MDGGVASDPHLPSLTAQYGVRGSLTTSLVRARPLGAEDGVDDDADSTASGPVEANDRDKGRC